MLVLTTLAAVLMASNGTIDGVMVDPAGKPVAGVSFSAVSDGKEYPATATDAQGHFKVTGVPRGSAYLFLESDAWWPESTREVPVPSKGLRVKLLPLRKLRVRVTGPDGRPAVDARLWITGALPGAGAEKTMRTNDDGVAEALITGTQATVRASLEGCALATVESDAAEIQLALQHEAPLKVRLDRPRATLLLLKVYESGGEPRVYGWGWLSQKLVERELSRTVSSYAPAPGAPYEAHGLSPGRYVIVEHDPAGFVWKEIDLPAGGLDLTLAPAPRHPLTVEVRGPDKIAEGTSLSLLPESRARVMAIPGYDVQSPWEKTGYEAEAKAHAPTLAAAKSAVEGAQTPIIVDVPADGRLTLDALPGEYTLNVRSDGYQPVPPRKVKVSETSVITVPLTPITAVSPQP